MPKQCIRSIPYPPRHSPREPPTLTITTTTVPNLHNFPPPRRNTPAPTSNLPFTSPYLAANTLYHNPPLSTNNLQHHLPNNAKLNSHNYLTPKPPCSFRKHIVFQAIHGIFLLSSLPPNIFFKNRFNGRENT